MVKISSRGAVVHDSSGEVAVGRYKVVAGGRRGGIICDSSGAVEGVYIVEVA